MLLVVESPPVVEMGHNVIDENTRRIQRQGCRLRHRPERRGDRHRGRGRHGCGTDREDCGSRTGWHEKTVAGTAAAELLLASVTRLPPAGAGPVRATVLVAMCFRRQSKLAKPLAMRALRPEPSPKSVTVCGDPAASSVIVTMALRLPAAAGVNVTAMPQFSPAARLVPQVFVWPKSPALAPVSAMLVIARALAPVLLSVIVCAAPRVPNVWLPKLISNGLTVT